MIRSTGRLGAVRVLGVVLWQLRFDLLAVLIVAGLLVPVPDASQDQYATAVLSVLGIGASVFIAFRNTTAYDRWWEARTLWGSQIINSRVLHNGLTAVDDGSPQMAAMLDRMRRRQVRYCWQLAAEMRGVPPLPGVRELTPEDPPGTDATELLNRQAAESPAIPPPTTATSIPMRTGATLQALMGTNTKLASRGPERYPGPGATFAPPAPAPRPSSAYPRDHGRPDHLPLQASGTGLGAR